MTTYKGISFPFRFGSSGGVATSKLTQEEHDRIYQSIYQIIFTYVGERVNNLEIGSRIRSYLFENIDDLNTRSLIKFEVEKAITTFEKRVQLLDVRVFTVEGEEGKLYVDIDVFILQIAKDTTMNYVINTEEV